MTKWWVCPETLDMKMIVLTYGFEKYEKDKNRCRVWCKERNG